MSEKTKTEKAIDYIAENGSARSPEIAKASGMKSDEVSSRMNPYVHAGVLVSCRVAYPGKPSCNEYRLAGHVPANAWRDFKANIHSAHEKQRIAPNKTPPITAPAPTPADQPQVSVKNSGSTPVESTFPPATGRAVTQEKPHRKTAQPVPGAGGHVPDKDQARFGYWSDGNLSIMQGDATVVLATADAKRLADFLMNCMISNEVNR